MCEKAKHRLSDSPEETGAAQVCAFTFNSLISSYPVNSHKWIHKIHRQQNDPYNIFVTLLYVMDCVDTF